MKFGEKGVEIFAGGAEKGEGMKRTPEQWRLVFRFHGLSGGSSSRNLN